MLTYTFAGDGWISIMPDFPGLGTAGVTTWMHSPDEGHSMLDATRAAREAFQAGFLSDKNAMIGHSNGGHAAFSAQAYAADYGYEGTIETVLTYSSFWLSNSAWGALPTETGDALITPSFMSMSMQYTYGHLDAYEGPEHNLDAFQPEKAQAARDLLEGACWNELTSEEAGPSSVGFEKGSDLFTQEFLDTVGLCALTATEEACASEEAQKWRERWIIDRPGIGTEIPIVYWMGSQDGWFSPGFQQCGVDRIVAQGGQLDLCISAEGSHSDLIPLEAAWSRDYLAYKLLGEADPGACTGVEVMPSAPVCVLPIPNSLDPNEP